MKSIINSLRYKLAMLFFALLSGVYAFAQDDATSKTDISINKSSSSSSTDMATNWYAAPWVWAVGAAVFILLLVALLRGGNRRAAA